MSTVGSYPVSSFSPSQYFLIYNPSTQTLDRVLGSELVTYVTQNADYVRAVSTRAVAQTLDFDIGIIVQTGGDLLPGDGGQGTFLVVASGDGTYAMNNGNDLLLLPFGSLAGSDLDGATITDSGTTTSIEVAVSRRQVVVPSVAGLYSGDWSQYDYLDTEAFTAGGFVGGAQWYKNGSGGTPTTSGTLNADLGGNNYVVDQGGNYWYLTQESRKNPHAYGIDTGNTASENYDIWQNIGRNFGGTKRTFYFENGTYQWDVFNPNNCIIYAEDATFEFTYNAAKSVVMGQITDCEVHGITFDSQEADLENQRCQIVSSEMVDCKFTGWLNPTNSNSWGVYLSGGGARCRLIRCGFQNNTQSDIAVVDSFDNIEIIQCYAIDTGLDPLVINLEPNNSIEENNVFIRSTDIGELYLLENGSGGTSNRQVSVDNCNIATLRYDGARAVIRSCQVTNFSVETQVFFGELILQNTLAIGPNLLEDPYLINIGLNSTQATTDSNAWYINNQSGSITNRIDALVENGVRFNRINPDSGSGALNFRPLNAIAATAGEYYLVAITGRLFGTDSRMISVDDGAAAKDSYVFRQGNAAIEYFTTEMAIIPAGATNDFVVKPGLWTTTTSGVDIYAISVHKVLGNGGGAERVLAGIHDIKPGPRELIVSTVPTMTSATVNGFQIGDKVIDGSKIHAWNGTGFSALW